MGFWLWLFEPTNMAHYYHEWSLGSLVLVLLVVFSIRSSLPALAAAAVGWAVLSGVSMMWFPLSRFNYLDLGRFDLFSLNAAKSVLSIFIVGSAGFLIPKKWSKVVLSCWAVGGSFLLLLGKDQGLFFNDSMEASFLACVFPMIYSPWVASLVLAAIIKSGSVTAWWALVLAVLCYMGSKKKWKPMIVTLIAGALIFLFLPTHHGLTEGSGRFQVWNYSIHYFTSHGNPWLVGFGTGSYGMLSAAILKNMTTNANWPWMHNDWLQIFFENGLIGLSLSLSCFFALLYQVRKTKELFSSVAAFGLIMCFQWPFHHIVSAFFAAFLMKQALSQFVLERNPNGIGRSSLVLWTS